MEDIERKESIKTEDVVTKKEKKKKLKEMKKLRYAIETLVVIIITVIMLVLITNKTFFREEYRKDNMKINIPLLTFFVSDKNNEIKLLTLRKSEYVKEYFDDYLSLLDRYTCGNNIFYYDEKYNTAIYNVDVEKGFAIKTITIKYDSGDINALCEE